MTTNPSAIPSNTVAPHSIRFYSSSDSNHGITAAANRFAAHRISVENLSAQYIAARHAECDGAGGGRQKGAVMCDVPTAECIKRYKPYSDGNLSWDSPRWYLRQHQSVFVGSYTTRRNDSFNMTYTIITRVFLVYVSLSNILK